MNIIRSNGDNDFGLLKVTEKIKKRKCFDNQLTRTQWSGDNKVWICPVCVLSSFSFILQTSFLLPPPLTLPPPSHSSQTPLTLPAHTPPHSHLDPMSAWKLPAHPWASSGAGLTLDTESALLLFAHLILRRMSDLREERGRGLVRGWRSVKGKERDGGRG